jgi:serine/threonine protein phosphatase 1
VPERARFGLRDHGRRERLKNQSASGAKPLFDQEKVDLSLPTHHEKTGRTIAIGDIHGCGLALAALIEAIRPSPGDEIVTLGDTIDGGPDSRGVLDQLLALTGRCRLVSLMGNHEQMLLAALESRSERAFWLKFGGDATLASYGGADEPEALPAEHLEFVRNCRPYHETDSHIFVHANYWPNMPMAELSSTVLYWEPLSPEHVGPQHSGKTVIVGHTPQPGGQILDLGYLKCIDTDCWRDGCLTALDVDTGRIWQANRRGELLD